MPFLLALLGILAAAAFWYFRMRDVGQAAHEVVDAAERVRGAYRRKRFRSKAESAALASVEDPAAAAAALLVSLAASRGRLSAEAEDAIRRELSETMALPNVDETFVFARWMADQATDPNDLSLRFSKLWRQTLQPAERADFYDMAVRIASLEGEPTDMQAGSLRLLRERLGLTRAP